MCIRDSDCSYPNTDDSERSLSISTTFETRRFCHCDQIWRSDRLPHKRPPGKYLRRPNRRLQIALANQRSGARSCSPCESTHRNPGLPGYLAASFCWSSCLSPGKIRIPEHSTEFPGRCLAICLLLFYRRIARREQHKSYRLLPDG